jgi:hypothetical protein
MPSNQRISRDFCHEGRKEIMSKPHGKPCFIHYGVISTFVALERAISNERGDALIVLLFLRGPGVTAAILPSTDLLVAITKQKNKRSDIGRGSRHPYRPRRNRQQPSR